MYKCKECDKEINLGDKVIYSEGGDSFDCPSCKATHTQEDIIAPPQNYSCPDIEEMNKLINNRFNGMAPINEMDSIYGVFTTMVHILADKVEYLEKELSKQPDKVTNQNK